MPPHQGQCATPAQLSPRSALRTAALSRPRPHVHGSSTRPHIGPLSSAGHADAGSASGAVPDEGGPLRLGHRHQGERPFLAPSTAVQASMCNTNGMIFEIFSTSRAPPSPRPNPIRDVGDEYWGLGSVTGRTAPALPCHSNLRRNRPRRLNSSSTAQLLAVRAAAPALAA